ncbi:PIG-L deacetylase family protein [Candidatus Cloacimonadota bacterium]
MKRMERILVLGPHSDDGEFGCGGTIAKFIEEGKEVYYAAFSYAEEIIPPELPSDIRLQEIKEGAGVLGINEENLMIYRYPIRKFAKHRQELLEDLVKLNREIQPDLVLMPSVDDLHQDHYTMAMEGLRAFKFTSILGYEMPWNNISFKTKSFIYLEKRHVEKKLEAVKCHKSQKGKKYANSEFIKSQARFRGVQCGVEFAETFDVLRWIIR